VRIFVYEFVTGGGAYESPGAGGRLDSLAAEALAMLHAAATDFCELAGVSIDVMRDPRLSHVDLGSAIVHEVTSASHAEATFCRLVRTADWTLLIAPEFNGCLLSRARTVEQLGGRLVGPGPALIALATDKQATADHLASYGIKVPPGIVLTGRQTLPRDFPLPAVLKPRDGCGSQGMQLVEQIPVGDMQISGGISESWRLETFCPGTSVSVACLCGPGGISPLPPCLQLLSADGRFTYRGGALPIDPNLANRATRRAVAAVSTLPESAGYLGVDLVLGDDPLGRDDVVIEINPRLTTSYIGYRALSWKNLAGVMIDAGSGRDVELAWREGSVEFDAAGDVRFQVTANSV
jgi:tyramine---L-glutamate ligase